MKANSGNRIGGFGAHESHCRRVWHTTRPLRSPYHVCDVCQLASLRVGRDLMNSDLLRCGASAKLLTAQRETDQLQLEC
jgi:hypothetical protein